MGVDGHGHGGEEVREESQVVNVTDEWVSINKYCCCG